MAGIILTLALCRHGSTPVEALPNGSVPFTPSPLVTVEQAQAEVSFPILTPHPLPAGIQFLGTRVFRPIITNMPDIMKHVSQ